jgi:hypothetical protein
VRLEGLLAIEESVAALGSGMAKPISVIMLG